MIETAKLPVESSPMLMPAALLIFMIVLGLFGALAFESYFHLTEGATYHAASDEIQKDNAVQVLPAKYRDDKTFSALDKSQQERQLDSDGSVSNWIGVAFFAGLIGMFALLISQLRSFFGKFNGRLMFALWLIAILGSYFAFLFKEGKYPMGIDLAGGTELIYALDYTQTDRNIDSLEKKKEAAPNEEERQKTQIQIDTLNTSKKTAPDKAAEVMRKRVDPTGTKGIPVTTLGRDKERLRIQLPKALPQEVERIKTAIKTQGRLSFSISDATQEVIEATMKSATGISPDGMYEKKVIKNKDKYTGKEKDEPIVIRRIPDMDGSHVTLAQARPSHEGTGWEINVRFDPQGNVEFGKLTEVNKHKRMAIVLDGTVYSAPNINDAIYGDCLISGNFDEESSQRLAGVLTAGSLPAEVKLISEFTVGPSLGQDQINSGMMATIIGTSVVIVFMIVYYRLAGAIAAFCMLLNLPMLIGAMGFFKATLTLPGIAGIVLTLGMAVDANVLILERLREELARGRTMRLAVAHGFDRAFLTIIDCHLTTLISATVLYYLGTGPVRGFAVSLSLGILTTLFCNVWLNRLIMEWLAGREALNNLTLMQLFKTTNIDFMGSRRLWMTLTGSMALIALILFLTFTTMSDRLYDVDFTGGTLIQFNFAHGKAKDYKEVEKTVDTTVLGDLQKDVSAIVVKLKEAAAQKKSGLELQTFLESTLPAGEALSKDDTSPEGLQALTARIEDAEKKLSDKEAKLATQGFDRPVTEHRYKSYTITTRLTEPIVIDVLNNDLIKTFKADLEPLAFERGEKSVTIRLNQTTAGIEKEKEKIQQAALDAAKDPVNSEIRDALTALKVEDLKADEKFPGYLIAQLGPLPTDLQQRAKVIAAADNMRIDDRAGGPISRKSGFGAAVAGEMKWQALLALVAANLGVFVYLWFRFEFSGAWGFGAIVALIHDVIIAAGGVVVANLLGFPILFNLNIVAALLTIVGYSVSDTIVVFDRIREVKAAHPTRSYEEIVNEAVNATLSRTILTQLTVLLADISLLIFGGPTIADMAYTLLVGFIVGTYSSIFIASPLMIWWYRSFGSGKAPAQSNAPKLSKEATGAQV